MPSSGELFDGQPPASEFSYHALYQELNTTVGVWFSISKVRSASLEVNGLEAGGSLAIHLSNAAVIPDNDDDGYTDQASITANGRYLFAKLPARFAKVKKTQGGTPTETDAIFHGVTN